MGLSKTSLFTSSQNATAAMAKALSNPARIAILEHLLKANTCVNGELVHEIGLAQPTISQHLRELKDVGLIQGSIEGTSISYCINREGWRKAEAILTALFQGFDPNCISNCTTE